MFPPAICERIYCVLDEIGRSRALTEDESNLLEYVLPDCDGRRAFRWNAIIDAALLDAADRSEVASFARLIGIKPNAAYQRLHRVRRRSASPDNLHSSGARA